MYHYNSDAILMVGGKGSDMPGTVNPLKPEGYWLHEAGMVGYVVEKRGVFELWTSHGEIARHNTGPGSRDRVSIGDWREAHHDQSGRTKGNWIVRGIVRWTADGVVATGEVPSRKLRHGVYK